MTTQPKDKVSLVTLSETDDQADYNSADSGEFEPGPPLMGEAGPLTGENTPQNLSGITSAHTSNPQSHHQEVDRLSFAPLIRDTLKDCLPGILKGLNRDTNQTEYRTGGQYQNNAGPGKQGNGHNYDSLDSWNAMLRNEYDPSPERTGYQRDYYTPEVPLTQYHNLNNYRGRTVRLSDGYGSRRRGSFYGHSTSPVGFGGFNSGNRSGYHRSNSSPRRSGYQDDSCRENYLSKEDLSVKVRPFSQRDTDWFTYKSHFEAIASHAGWSPKTKCIKLMGALQGSLTGVTAGLRHSISYDQLVSRLDSVHGISNDREDALIKLSNCRKGQDEPMPMYGERIRQLIERAYPSYSPGDKDEQAIRVF